MKKLQTALILGAAGAAAYVAWRSYRGVSGMSAGGVASSVASGAVNAVGGVVSGAVGAVGSAVGLPTPSQTTTDAAVARWIIDNAGYWEASKWAGAPALFQAMTMTAGTGTPPPPGSAAAQAFSSQIARASAPDTGDETERLLRRYPAPYTPGPSALMTGEGSFSDIAGRWDYYNLGGRAAASGSGSFEDQSQPGGSYWGFP